MTAGPPRCAWPPCDKPARAHKRGSPPRYCKDHANLAKHARARRKTDPCDVEFWFALILAAHRGRLTPSKADALAAHHGRAAHELAATLIALTDEQYVVKTAAGWTLHADAMTSYPAILARLGKPGRNPGPSMGHKPGGNPGPSKARQTRKPGGNPGGPALDSAPLPLSGFPRSAGEQRGHRAAQRFMESLTPVLRDAGDRTLYRASLTVSPDARETIDDMGRAFVDRMMIEGARGVFLAKDIGGKGRPHWYGIIIRAGGGAIGRAWEGISGADSGAYRVGEVGGWNMYAATGELDVPADHNRTFRQHLTRAIDYTFKAWPVEHGARDLASDVIASGVFSAVWDDVVAHVDG